MRPIAALDCETDPFKYGHMVEPFIWGVYYVDKDGRGEFRHDRNFAPLLEWLLAKDEKIVVYAHNAGRFDFLFKDVIEQIVSGTRLKIIHGRLAQFRIGNLELRDSLSAVPVALSKYKKDKFDYRLLTRKKRAANMPKIIKYLRSDCVNLWELMSNFAADYGSSLTLAGASMKAAAKIEDFDVPKSTAAYFRDLKPFYYGGRVESFASGKVAGPVYSWDINSAYPHAMTLKHPWGARYHRRQYAGGKIQNASCLIIKAQSLGAFPFGDKKYGTSFPSDGEVREFRVTGWEFNAAKDCGLLGTGWKISDVYDFPEKRTFTKYIEHFYRIRMEAADDSPQKLFGKLFMNSLYGRFGMDGSAYEEYRIDENDAELNLANDGWYKAQDTIDGRAIYARAEHKERWRFHDIATALSVTGCVRAKLLRTKHEVERKRSTMLYMDTDGIKTKGPWRAVSSKKLGDWKLEDVSTKAFFGGKKLYACLLHKKYWKKDDDGKLVKWKKAHKGVVLSPAQIIGIAADGKTIQYKKAAPSMGILSGNRFIKRNVRSTNKKAA